MSLDKLNAALAEDVATLTREGRTKAPERIIVGYLPPAGGRGPRYRLRGTDQAFLRMNSNSYLSLSNHVEVVTAADQPSHQFGVGPGAVRFIDGTFAPHVDLEARIAAFVGRPAARIFNSAYTTVLGVAITLSGPDTYWIGDALNHNCIIRAMRIANVPSAQRTIYQHNDLADLATRLDQVPAGIGRVVVIFDGIFSMRGDTAPLEAIASLVARHEHRFRDGVVTVMDDSHGVGAYGATGRGTEEYCGAKVDILIGTFGKAFGVNGGFAAGSPELAEAIRQKADTLHLYQPTGRRRRRCGGQGDRDCGRSGRAAAPWQPRGPHGAVPRGPGDARLRVDPRSSPGRAAARARHRPHPLDRRGPVRPRDPGHWPHVPGSAQGR